jgi:hypothetical protein
MKNPIHRALNLSLYIAFCLMLGTGVIMEYRLPPGSGRMSVLGLTRHQWGDWHYYIALAFLLLVFWHLWMNRIWLHKIAGRMKSWRVVLGLFAGVALVVGMILLPIQKNGEPGGEPLEGGDCRDCREQGSGDCSAPPPRTAYQVSLIWCATRSGCNFQMSSAYSRMVRSLENFPMRMQFKNAIRAQPMRSR